MSESVPSFFQPCTVLTSNFFSPLVSTLFTSHFLYFFPYCLILNPSLPIAHLCFLCLVTHHAQPIALARDWQKDPDWKVEVEPLLCVCERARNCIYPYSLWEHTAVALQMTRERWQRERASATQREKKKCTMALLQTIAINGIIFSPQRLHWEQWTIRADGLC